MYPGLLKKNSKPTFLILLAQPKYFSTKILIFNKIYAYGKISLTLNCIMLKNGQTYFKNLAVFTPQDF